VSANRDDYISIEIFPWWVPRRAEMGIGMGKVEASGRIVEKVQVVI
jgi:hypothetical protein